MIAVKCLRWAWRGSASSCSRRSRRSCSDDDVGVWTRTASSPSGGGRATPCRTPEVARRSPSVARDSPAWRLAARRHCRCHHSSCFPPAAPQPPRSIRAPATDRYVTVRHQSINQNRFIRRRPGAHRSRNCYLKCTVHFFHHDSRHETTAFGMIGASRNLKTCFIDDLRNSHSSLWLWLGVWTSWPTVLLPPRQRQKSWANIRRCMARCL